MLCVHSARFDLEHVFNQQYDNDGGLREATELL